MASSMGEMSEAEIGRLKKAFEEKVGGDQFKCVVCSHEDITLVTQIVTPLTSNQNGTVHATLYVDNKIALRRHLPCITTICNRCANVQFFSLIGLGVELDAVPSLENGDAE